MTINLISGFEDIRWQSAMNDRAENMGPDVDTDPAEVHDRDAPLSPHHA